MLTSIGTPTAGRSHLSPSEEVEKIFAAEEALVSRIAEIRDVWEDPEVRKKIGASLDKRKEELKALLESLPGEEPPPNTERIQELILDAYLKGMIVGDFKTVLALIPPASLQCKPKGE